jgi:hypothetical protein
MLALLIFLPAATAAAAPGNPIGSAVTVVSYVTADLEDAGNPRQLRDGDDVRQQELIEVDQSGRSEIELNDRTKLALGPGARLLLDRFVYDPGLDGGAIVVNLVRGAFRFITGVAAKPAYVIRTPNASITVRGTIFDVFVARPNETWVLLIEGGVEACTASGRCVVNDQPGKLIRISDDDIEGPQSWSRISRGHDVAFNEAFPFIVTPPEIDPNVIFTRDDIAGAAVPAKGGGDKDRYEEPRKSKPKRSGGDDYTPPPRRIKIKKKRIDREYVRETHYHPRPRPRGREILKKGIRAGVAVGIGLGVGYGIAKAFKKRY